MVGVSLITHYARQPIFVGQQTTLVDPLHLSEWQYALTPSELQNTLGATLYDSKDTFRVARLQGPAPLHGMICL
jgi:hypothetical protein